MSHAKTILTSCLILLACGNPILGETEISIVAYPRFSFEPATMKLTIKIEPHQDNREACLELDGGMYSSSCWPLEGENHKRTTEKMVKDLSAGEYQVRLTVRRVSGEEIHATTKFCVIPRGGEINQCV